VEDERQLDRRAFLVGAGSVVTGAALPPLGYARVRKGIPNKLSQAIRGHVFYKGQPGYGGARLVFNSLYDFVMPQAVARPINAKDVQAAVQWCVAKGVPMRARSGGHSYQGYSTLSHGVMVDLRKLNQININIRGRYATVGAGCQLIDIYRALSARGVTVPGGSCPSVGVSGVTLGGGMGLAARNFGMTTDNVLGVQIVTADGKLRQVNPRSGSDLYWALRGGGGGNFGVVTQFTFRIHPIPSTATYFNVEFPWSQATAAIEAWQAWAPHTTTKITSILHVNGGSGGGSINANGQFFGSPSQLRGLIGPLLSVPGAQLQTNISLGYFPLQMLLAGCSQKSFPQCHTVGTFPGANMPRLPFRAGSDYVGKPLSAAGRRAVVNAAEASGAAGGALLFDSYGGAINRVHPNATAFVHRNQLFCIQYYVGSNDASWVNRARSIMHPYVSGQSYQNYIDKNLKHWQQAYYGSNYKRLQQIRKKYDPHHFFNFPQAIGR
jgi:FAD/FMN-containing dehydrogenase